MGEERTIQSICEEALAEIEDCWRLGIDISVCHWKTYFKDILKLVNADVDDGK